MKVPPSSSSLEANLWAAIRLLEDTDPHIRQACRRELLKHPKQARPLLRVARCHAVPQIRAQARSLLEVLAGRNWLRSFRTFARRSGEAADLEEGAILIARFGRPGLRRGEVAGVLDAWARELGPRVEGRTPGVQAEELGRFFHEEKGLSGNEGSYHEPENSYLDRVLARRVGIPIALAAVYLLVCRRAGLALEGVGLPGHFLVRLRGRRSVLLDPFWGGRVLTRADCMKYLCSEGFGFHPSHLDPVDDRRILVRMLTNLIHVFGFREDMERIALLAEARKTLVGAAGGG